MTKNQVHITVIFPNRLHDNQTESTQRIINVYREGADIREAISLGIHDIYDELSEHSPSPIDDQKDSAVQTEDFSVLFAEALQQWDHVDMTYHSEPLQFIISNLFSISWSDFIELGNEYEADLTIQKAIPENSPLHLALKQAIESTIRSDNATYDMSYQELIKIFTAFSAFWKNES